MANAQRCGGCGGVRVEVTFGPMGFLQTCSQCRMAVDLDDVMEPVAFPVRGYAPLALSMAA